EKGVSLGAVAVGPEAKAGGGLPRLAPLHLRYDLGRIGMQGSIRRWRGRARTRLPALAKLAHRPEYSPHRQCPAYLGRGHRRSSEGNATDAENRLEPPTVGPSAMLGSFDRSNGT